MLSNMGIQIQYIKTQAILQNCKNEKYYLADGGAHLWSQNGGGRRQKQDNLSVRGQPGLQCEFWDSQGYTEKLFVLGWGRGRQIDR